MNFNPWPFLAIAILYFLLVREAKGRPMSFRISDLEAPYHHISFRMNLKGNAFSQEKQRRFKLPGVMNLKQMGF